MQSTERDRSERPAEAPCLGVGIGLRVPHYAEALERARQRCLGVEFIEIISENFMGEGGRPKRILESIRNELPVVMHGVSLNIGSSDPLNRGYLDDLDALARLAEPRWLSDHLCWTGVGGQNLHDLLPLPACEEVLSYVAQRIARVQDRLGRRIAIENVSSYMSFTADEIDEWTFLAELAERADCGLLLDVNNVYVSAHNHGFDAQTYLDSIPAHRIFQIHLAGHSQSGPLLIDTHDHPVRDDVWALYERVIARIGPVSTLIEWDDRIPALDRLVEEAARARGILERVGGPLRGDSAPASPKGGDRRAGGDGREEVGWVSSKATETVARRPRAPESLVGMQRLVRALVTAPAGVAPALAGEPGVPGWLDEWPDLPGALAGWIEGDANLDSARRLDVYAQAYFLRLHEVLLEDHPTVAWICGEGFFNDLVTAFLVAHPSTSPNLRELGRPFATFIEDHGVAAFVRDRWPVLGSVARLEWAFCEVFDAEDQPALARSDLAGIPPEQWAEIPLSPVAAFVRLEFDRRVAPFVRARREGQAAPQEIEEPETLIVWRDAERAVYREADRLEADALALVESGTSFGDLCAWATERVGDAAAAPAAAGWLADWVDAGWLIRPPGLSRLG